MLKMKLKIVNANIVDKDNDFYGSVLIEDGTIIKVGTASELENEVYDEVYDINGLTLMPAFVDVHSHFRTPGFEYKEDFTTGLSAALKGGYGTVFAMANTNPVCDSVELVSENNQKANALKKVNFNQIPALGKNLRDVEFVDYVNLRKHCAIFSNDGITVFSDDFMREALKMSTKYDFSICTHSEPEVEIVTRDVALLKNVGGNLHVCHISTQKTVEAIIVGKEANLNISCEVTPHHLFDSGLDYHVAPVFGTEEDRQALISAVKRGIVDILATDHAPHTKKDKEKGANGISNIEVAFQMYWKVFSDNDISLRTFSKMISYNPAKLTRLNKGLIKAGYDADLVVIDKDRVDYIDINNFVSKSNNTPFDKREVRGKVIMTIVDGEKRYSCE